MSETCPECAEKARTLELLLNRLEVLERQREHLDNENRRLALDLYRATSRLAVT